MSGKKLFMLALLCSDFTAAHSQIRLSPDDIIHKGRFNMALDTGFYPGSAGAGQTWDFSTLKPATPFGYSIAAYDGKGNGNAANLVKTDGTDTFAYYLRNAGSVYEVVPLQNFDLVDYRNLLNFSFPFSYNDAMEDSIAIEHRYNGVVFGMPSVDSVRLSFKMTRKAVADAWGQMKLPALDVPVLRVRSETSTMVRMYGKTGNQPYAPVHAFDQDDTERLFQWYGKDMGCALVTYHADTREMEYLLSAVLVLPVIKDQCRLVFANPFGDQWVLHNPGDQSYRIAVYDLKGSLIAQNEIGKNAELYLDMTPFPSGIYLLQVINAYNGHTDIFKVSKNDSR